MRHKHGPYVGNRYEAINIPKFGSYNEAVEKELDFFLEVVLEVYSNRQVRGNKKPKLDLCRYMTTFLHFSLGSCSL